MGRLYWKFFLFLFLAQLTTAIGVGVFILFKINQDDRQQRIVDQSPVGQSLMDAAQSTLSLGGEAQLKALLNRWQSQGLMHQVYVLNEHQQDLLNRKIEPHWLESIRQPIPHESLQYPTHIKQSKNGHDYVIFAVYATRGYARFGPPPPPDRDGRQLAGMGPPPNDRGAPSLFRILTTFPLKGLLIGTLASILFAAILAWYFSKPIKSLRLAFKRAADGDLNVTVADQMGSRKDELSDLGYHFDHMASRLGALMQGQTRLLHHVSHEMRSPLARMHMALGLATQNPERVESALNRIELEANRMDKLIGELLELSRFESGMVDMHKEPYALNEVLETIIEDAAFEASSKRIHIKFNIQQTYVLHGQADLIHRAIENVVRNAIKYAPNDSIVSINCQSLQPNQVDILVIDQGSGVLATELEDIFKPFVRGNSGSQVVGHGVGLAITKQVVEVHGGNVVAENLKPYGFSIHITLPI
jgi:signal transduction histidine kinase